MPDFNQQIDSIARVRQQCRQHEENLYGARVAIAHAEQRLRRAEQEQTIAHADRDAEMGKRRAQISALETRLGALREGVRRIDDGFARIAEQERLVAHLQQNLTAARGRAVTLRRYLAELRQHDPLPADEIRRAEADLDSLGRNEHDLNESASAVADVLGRLREQEQAQQRERAARQTEMETIRESLRGIQDDLTDLLRPVFDDLGALEAEQRELEAAAERFRRSLTRCGGELGDLIGGLYEDPHPRGPLARLDDRIPFLLFPVRIETIFVPVDRGTELWVRIYPDDIVVHTHESTLTDSEVRAGELYWTELVAADHLRDERDGRRQTAWRHLVQLLGGQRAAWVTRETKPSDWDALAASGVTETLIDLLREADGRFFDDLLDLPLADKTRAALKKAIADGDADAFSRLAEEQKWGARVNAAVRTRILGFPEHDLTKTDAWTRAPRTRVLPDRFVLMLYGTEAAAPRQIPGALVPDTLTLGPDPLDAKAGFTPGTPTAPLTFGAAFDWMSNFDKAVEQGMGFRVGLSDEEARTGFARILVLGVLLSASARESAAMLEELIDNHQFSPKGFTIVPQGTPTNNTERKGTGYSDNDPYDDLAFFTDTDPPAFDPTAADPRRSQTDGRRLADALGISYRPLQTVRNADGTDVLEATAMNAALFPTTMGYWLRTWMSPVVTPAAARLTRAFFTRFVTGRGPLPAARVGNQPYGILVTSDLSRWKYPTRAGIVLRFDEETPFLIHVQDLLSRLEKMWSGIAATLPFVGKPGSDSSDVLMNLLGLHPTSVELFQRIGFSDEYLRNMDSFKDRGRYANELASLIRSMPASARGYIRNLGFEEDSGTVGKMRSLHVLWQHYVTSLDAPNLVENKPPSETDRLTVNYIDWLAKADSASKIISEQFGGPKQSALLYMMLRNALLLQLHHGAYDWLVERSVFEAALEQSVHATTLPGVRVAVPTLSKYEIMATKVAAVDPAHALPTTTVADLIWRGFEPVDIEAGFVGEQRSALHVLAGATTASLERAFVEHLDCCQYRLDAWETGLFAHRLQAQRGSGPDDRRTGIHLGAFGWVEHVIPSKKRFLRREDVPVSIRPADTRPILEEDDTVTAAGQHEGFKQGGFMHAPSINHASAAALLRNAYLSHADPSRAEMFSVNLSSERVRRAEFVLAGMRNGQPMEALLGYQFERGLHDRTSASAANGDVPVLELNQFILPYRDAFPFQSREVVQTGTGVPTETIPPYSVVNGLSLTTATLSAANGYGLAAVLAVPDRPNAAQGAAVLAARECLLDTLDAVKDVLMAENAYQLVQGNFDRVAAVSLAQKEARIPPELQVVETPRGSEFTFTNRVTLQFDDLDPALASSNPWPAVPLTPRARFETGVNHWLGTVLGGAPARIRCDVYRVEKAADGSETAHDRHPVTLEALGIQPVDFVWMVGISPEQTGGATELEMRTADRYRRDHAIGPDEIVRIEFNPTVAAGDYTFAQLFPLARQLRALVSQSRALGAEDFLPAAGGRATTIVVDPANPGGYYVGELRARVQSALAALTTLADALDGPSAPPVQLVFLNDPANAADDETFSGQLGAAVTRLEDARLEFTDAAELAVSVLISDAETLCHTLRAVSDFGISDAFAPEVDLTGIGARAEVLARAHRVARRLRRPGPRDGILDRAVEIVGRATPDKTIGEQVRLLLDAAKVLFADAFTCLPEFTPYNEIDLATANAARGQLLAHVTGATAGTPEQVVDEWLQGLARVRPQIHRWETVRLLADALNDAVLEMRPVQVPYRAKDSWLAVEFPKNDPLDPAKPFRISRDTLSIAAHGATAFVAGARQRGVLLDEWTEEIPTDREITGIAFRFNQPNAAPPQVLLLAVTPEETGSWSWDDLVGTLTDTLGRAKRRAVEPADLEKQQGLFWNAFAPALVSEFSTLEEADVSLDLMRMLSFSALSKFYAARSSH